MAFQPYDRQEKPGKRRNKRVLDIYPPLSQDNQIPEVCRGHIQGLKSGHELEGQQESSKLQRQLSGTWEETVQLMETRHDSRERALCGRSGLSLQQLCESFILISVLMLAIVVIVTLLICWIWTTLGFLVVVPVLFFVFLFLSRLCFHFSYSSFFWSFFTGIR